MRLLCTLFAALGLAAPLAAGQDWVGLRAIRVAEPGSFQASLGVSHGVEESWAMGSERVKLLDANGVQKLRRQIEAVLGLAWQFNAVCGIKLSLPYNLVEFSPTPPSGTIPNFRLDDPELRRNESGGDTDLELRSAWGPEPGRPGWSGAGWLGVIAPTGIGPYEAPHPLANTGDGRWQVVPGLGTGWTIGAWSLLLQVSAPVQLGRESTLSGQAALGYGATGAQLPVGGNVWLGPRFGADGGLGLAWDWYTLGDVRQTLGLELKAWQCSPLDQGGVLTPDTAQRTLGFIPQLQAHFGRFHALAAWQLPFLYADNVAASDSGSSHLRVDYGF